MEIQRYGNNPRDIGVKVLFINELEHFTPDEIGVRFGYLILGEQPREGYESVVFLEEIEIEDEDRELYDSQEWIKAEVRAINIFDVESVLNLIVANMDTFEDIDFSPRGLERDTEKNVDLALLLSGEAIARYFQSEVLAEC